MNNFIYVYRYELISKHTKHISFNYQIVYT